jgi:hypothetical protein
MPFRSKQKSPATLGLMLSTEPVRAAFQRRSMNALNRIAANASIESLQEALAAPTDVGTLARVLGDGTLIGAAVVELEPLAPLIARNAEHRLELLRAAGGFLTSEEVGALLEISRQAVDKRRQAGTLLAMRQGRDWRYPRCQFRESARQVAAGLPKLLNAFGAKDPWAVLDFMLAPDDTLQGKTPLEILHAQGCSESLDRLLRIEQGDGFG